MAALEEQNQDKMVVANSSRPTSRIVSRSVSRPVSQATSRAGSRGFGMGAFAAAAHKAAISDKFNDTTANSRPQEPFLSLQVEKVGVNICLNVLHNEHFFLISLKHLLRYFKTIQQNVTWQTIVLLKHKLLLNHLV